MLKRTFFLTVFMLLIFSSLTLAQESLILIDATVCQSIQNREPVGIKDVFSKDVERVYCYTKAGSLEPTKIKHVWYYKDAKMAEISLKIGASPGWRTRSSKTIMQHQTGNWRVDVVGSDGKVLKTIRFMVE